jgi:catechol 2,3-dioxygenase
LADKDNVKERVVNIQRIKSDETGKGFRRSAMPVIKPALHHINFKTTRLNEMIAWYGTVLGGTINFMDEHNAWMTNDEANHRFAFLSVPGLEDDPDKVKHDGLHHSAFEYERFSDLMSSYARLRDQGIVPAFCLDHGITTSLYYKDPDGNFVELQTDNFGDWRRSTEWMRTSSDFRSNPIGTFFDPERVYQAYASGQSLEELHPAMRAAKFLPDVIPSVGLPISVNA